MRALALWELSYSENADYHLTAELYSLRCTSAIPGEGVFELLEVKCSALKADKTSIVLSTEISTSKTDSKPEELRNRMAQAVKDIWMLSAEVSKGEALRTTDKAKVLKVRSISCTQDGVEADEISPSYKCRIGIGASLSDG